MHLPIELLQTFVKVAETRNFTAAAKQIFRSQSAVSQQMKRLADTVGMPLFDMEGKQVHLTPMGELVLEHALKILKVHDTAAMAIQRSGLKGKIRFGTPEDYAMLFIPGILARFAREFPEIRVDVICQPSPALYADLLNSELDLMISTALDAGGEEIRKEPVIWAGSDADRLPGAESLPLAVYDQDCIYRHWATSALEEQHQPCHIAFMSPSIAGILAAVRSGLAVAPIGLSALPGDLVQLGKAQGLPSLPQAGVCLHQADNLKKDLTDKLAVYVRQAFASSRPGSEGA